MKPACSGCSSNSYCCSCALFQTQTQSNNSSPTFPRQPPLELNPESLQTPQAPPGGPPHSDIAHPGHTHCSLDWLARSRGLTQSPYLAQSLVVMVHGRARVLSCFTHVRLCDSVGCSLPLLCPRDCPGRNTGVGWHALLQGIFLTQGSNLCLLHRRQIPYC